MGIFRLPRPVLAVLATLFASWALLYSGLWMWSASRPIPVELGFDNEYLPATHAQLVKRVLLDSPAERAGMRAGDHIIAIDGSALQEDTLVRVWSERKPGDAVELSIVRAGVNRPITLHAVFRASGPTSAEASMLQHLGRGINDLFPIVFLTVGLAVLFLRLEDPHAWLMALMFGSFIAIPGFANAFLGVPSALRPVVVAYRALFNNMVAPLFYFFFAVFPTRSALDRRVPWLKWLGVIFNTVLGVLSLFRDLGRGPEASGLVWTQTGHVAILCFNYGLVVLAFVSLTSNAISATSPEARRKIRVILWGTLIGVIPPSLSLAAVDFFGYDMGLLVGTIMVVLLWLFPLSFAYAVVKHRVLEVPALLRRSARYLLVQRGFVVSLVAVSIVTTIAFALFFARYLQFVRGAAVPGGIALGTIFGSVLLWTGSRVHQAVGKQIDRAFFRSAYDARVILEDLVQKTRTATDRKELATLLDHHLKQALQPSSAAVFFETANDQLAVVAGEVPPGSATLSPAEPALRRLAESAEPQEVSGETDVPNVLLPLRPDCLAPILGRDDRLAGLIVLGMRLSEEPYSREDKHLLASVTNQAGIALESFRLGEKVAERIEAERRAAQEMEFARQVQTRLFPQKFPVLHTLEYAGGCSPARTVGGDYYDFLELKPGRLGVVLADIAGKGVPGALLMANLQANLRSQYALAVEDLPRLLASVNRLFYQSTDDASYATLFFADYDDSRQVLRYANCGHLPALVLHSNGDTESIQHLSSTCTVLGLLENWQSQVAEVQLKAGDLFVLYTDGITEATNAEGEEFGEERLVATLRRLSRLSPAEVMEGVVHEVRQFSRGEQQDDITLVVARCRVNSA